VGGEDPYPHSKHEERKRKSLFFGWKGSQFFSVQEKKKTPNNLEGGKGGGKEYFILNKRRGWAFLSFGRTFRSHFRGREEGEKKVLSETVLTKKGETASLLELSEFFAIASA